MQHKHNLLEARAHQYGRMLLIINMLFIPIGIYFVIVDRSYLGLTVGVLVTTATVLYIYLQRILPIRPLTMFFFTAQLIAIGAGVHSAGGFLSNASVLYCASLAAVCLILEYPRYIIGATALTIFSFLGLVIGELLRWYPADAYGNLINITSSTYHIASILYILISVFGIGLVMIFVMREITKRQHLLEDASISLEQRAEQTKELVDQVEATNIQLQHKEEMLRQTIDALTITALPVSDHVLVLPLIGVFDDTRAFAVQKRIIDDLHGTNTQTVIVDLTSINVANESFLWMLNRIITGARLLGVQVILAGLQPDLARRLVHLDFNRSQVRSVASLAQALKVAQLTPSSMI